MYDEMQIAQNRIAELEAQLTEKGRDLLLDEIERLEGQLEKAIVPKFKIGQEVWYFFEQELRTDFIKKYHINTGTMIRYNLSNGYSNVNINSSTGIFEWNRNTSTGINFLNENNSTGIFFDNKNNSTGVFNSFNNFFYLSFFPG